MPRETFLALGNPVWRRNRNAPSSLWLTVLSATAIARRAGSLPARFNGAMWSTMQPGQASSPQGGPRIKKAAPQDDQVMTHLRQMMAAPSHPVATYSTYFTYSER